MQFTNMTRAIRQMVWFVSAFFTKYKHIILASFFLAALGGVLAIGILPRLPKPKAVQYIGLVGRFNLSQIPSEVESKLGVGLTTINERQEPSPGIASRWEILEGGKVYRFYLQPGLRWSNGQELHSEDIILAIPSVSISHAPEYIEFRLPDVYAPFPAILSKPVVKDGFLTVGPYTLKDIQTEGQYLVKLVLDSPQDTIIYRFYTTQTAAITAFKAGEIDRLVELPERPSISDWPNVTLKQTTDLDKFVAIFFNFDDPIVGKKNKEMRQALAYAINDKTAGQNRALSPISPKSWAYNKAVKSYDFDLVRAKSLFVKATEGNKDTVKLELSVTPELLSLADTIKVDWEALGASVEIKVVSSALSEYQTLMTSEEIPTDPDQYALWHSTQETTNITHFKDEQVDKNLEDGRRTIDLEARRKIYLDFQRFLLEESPAIFLYYPQKYELIRI